MTQDLHKNFDKIISSKLENQSVDVNDGLWENVNNRLLEKQLVKSKQQIRFQRIAIISITALFIASLIIFIHPKNKSGQDITLLKKENTKISQNSPKDNTGKLQQENKPDIKPERPKVISQSDKNEQLKKNIPASVNKQDKQNPQTLSKSNDKQIKISEPANQPTNNEITKTQQPSTITPPQKSPIETTKITAKDLSVNEKPGNINTYLPVNNDTSVAQRDSTTQLLPTQNLLTQDNTNNSKEPEKKEFSIQVFASPEYAYRSLRNNKAYFNPKHDKAYFNSRDKGQFSFSAGLLLSVKIKPKLNISTGVSYSKFSQKFTTEGFNIETTNSSNGYLYTSTGITNVSTNNSDTVLQQALLRSSLQLSYINVPIVAEFYYLPNLFVQGGINFNILAKEDMNWQAENENEDDDCEISTDNIEGLKTTNVSFIIGAGKEFPLFKTYKFVFQPSFRIFLTSINDKNTVKTYPYSYFLHLAIKKTF